MSLPPMSVTVYGRPQGGTGAPSQLAVVIHPGGAGGARVQHNVNLWDHGDQLAHDAVTNNDRNARGMLADWVDENSHNFQAVPEQYRPYIGQLIRRGHRWPPEPPTPIGHERLSRRTTTLPVLGVRDHALSDPTVLARYGRVAQVAMAGVAADREGRRRERLQGRVRRYSATEGDVNNLLSQIAANPDHRQPGSHLRLVAADALQEQGRDREADVLRNHPHRVQVLDNTVFREYPLPQHHRDTALSWHGGGGSGLYQIGSTGRVTGYTAREALEELDDVRSGPDDNTGLDDPRERRRVDALYDHLARIERETADEYPDGDDSQGQVTLSRRNPRRYGLLPRDEITTFSDQGNAGGQYDPNNVADAVFADRLEDIGDPRHLIVRRDLEHRGATNDEFRAKHRDYHVRLANGTHTTGLGRHHPAYWERELPDGTRINVNPYGVMDRYGNNEDIAPTSYEITWDTPRNVYYGAFSPEERDAIVEGLRNEVGDQEPSVDRMSRDHTVLSKEKARRRYAKSSKDVGEVLRETAFRLNDELELGPDYQRLFWNPKTKVAWYVTADGDEESEVKKVRNALENVPGVDHVRVEAEYFPPDDDSGWVEMYDRNDPDEGWKPWPPKERKSRRRYAAYRAPAGGMVTRGTAQKGGQFVPDMNGAFVKAAQKLQGQVTPPAPVRKGDAPGDFSDNPSLSEPTPPPKPGTTGRRGRRRRKLNAQLTNAPRTGKLPVSLTRSRRLTVSDTTKYSRQTFQGPGFEYTIEPSQGDGYKITSPYGYIDYRPTENGNEIWWVESHKKNHGKDLVDLMQKHHPSDTIGWGVTTGSGKAFRDRYHKLHPELGMDTTPFDGQFDPSGNNYGEDNEDEDEWDSELEGDDEDRQE